MLDVALLERDQEVREARTRRLIAGAGEGAHDDEEADDDHDPERDLRSGAVRAGGRLRSGRHAATIALRSGADHGLRSAVRRSQDPTCSDWVAAAP